MIIKEKLGHHFIRDLINERSVVIDLGGNVGEFSKFIAENIGAVVYVLEPIKCLFARIPENNRIKKFNYCVGAKDGLRKIYIPNDSCATIYKKGYQEVICYCTKLDTFIREHNIFRIDLLKVDIEGAEIEVFETISDQTLKIINQMTIEFHDFLWPELKTKVKYIKKRIEKLGYYCIRFSITNNGDVLFIKKNMITRWQYFYIKYFERIKRGIIRRVRRYLNNFKI